jgi:hypothetical protein
MQRSTGPGGGTIASPRCNCPERLPAAVRGGRWGPSPNNPQAPALTHPHPGTQSQNSRTRTRRHEQSKFVAVSALVGTPSDECPDVLATGRTDVTTIYASFSERHPDGRDADYLAWHSLDHRPEQQRLPMLRSSFRVVSTPACRAVRAASDRRFDAADHLMTYLFTALAAMDDFNALSVALREAGRAPYLLPTVERAAYRLDGSAAAPRIKVGADVLPWWPRKGVYVLVERGQETAEELVGVPGVGGAWWGGAEPLEPPFCTRDNSGLHITYLFLDDDPVVVARRLSPILTGRWSTGAVEPLLAAPFYGLVDYDWDRYRP